MINSNLMILILILILINPLIWTFSERATADFFPMTLSVFASTLFISNKNRVLAIIKCGLFFGIASIIKYHSLLLLFFLWALEFNRNKKESKINVLLVAIIAISICITFIVKIHTLFGFWITPEKFAIIHKFNLSNILNNFILYLGFLFLLSAPTLLLLKDFWLFILKNRKFAIILFIGLFLFFVFFGIADIGELNFGRLDNNLPKNFRVFVLSIFSFFGLLIFFYITENKAHKFIMRKYIGYAIILVLLILALTRPANRYLIFLIPYFVLVFPSKFLKSKFLIFSILSVFIITNIYIENARYLTAISSQEMYKKILSEEILTETNPGEIEAHQGNNFFQFKELKKRFIVVSGDGFSKKNAIIHLKFSNFGFTRDLYVIPID